MIDLFPIFSDNSQLAGEDFTRFSASFAEILKKRLPTAVHVDFFHSINQLKQACANQENFSTLENLFLRLIESEQRCGILPNSVMLPFTLKDGTKIVAVATGGDDIFYAKVREDWLLEVKESVVMEFLLLKQARVDIQTGLLNLSNLFSLLQAHGTRKDLQLILLELPPRRSSFHYVLRHSQKCAAVLQAFIQKDSVLHYLGHCTFALILVNDSDQGQEVEGALVSYLKREGCHRVHIGCSAVRASENTLYPGKRLLDEAWAALRQAKNRGPFSFCNYASLAHPEKHPLAPPDRNILRRLQRIWAGDDRFCLVCFRSDIGSPPAKNVVPDLLERGVTVEAGDDVLVYLSQEGGRSGVQWAREVIARARQQDGDIHVSAGVSCFPYSDFKKTEMVINCRKALLHAAFYGRSSVALFDAVSLNISGDVYFTEGDLTKAVKEYKRGLKSDDRDINLHNSLGVALAMMNKLSPAMKSFENGLRVEPNNFMALYNLGLAEQARDRKEDALTYFKRALKYYRTPEKHSGNGLDLKLQIGILCCDVGRYQEAIEHLVPWNEKNSNSPKAGRISYYLGRAYHGVSDNGRAMSFLQKALRFDEFDDRAMNLLGRIFLLEGEGDDIALALVRKSVELEPSCIRYRLHLAEVLLQCRLYVEAKENLYRCLKYRSSKSEAQLLLAKTYLQEGLDRRAAAWFKKVVASDEAGEKLQSEAQKGLTQIRIQG